MGPHWLIYACIKRIVGLTHSSKMGKLWSKLLPASFIQLCQSNYSPNTFLYKSLRLLNWCDVWLPWQQETHAGLTSLAAIAPQALFLCVEVMVGGLPELGQPKALLTAGLSVDGVGSVWSVNFYGIFIACGSGFWGGGGGGGGNENYNWYARWQCYPSRTIRDLLFL